MRWVWSGTAHVYPALLRAGVRVGRCHDVALAGALLAGRDAAGRDAAGRDEAGPGATGDGTGRVRAVAAGDGPAQDVLFEPVERAPPDLAAQLDAVIAAHAGQLRAIAADEHPARFGALVAAESAGSLVAAEMSYAGIPWRADVHDQLLTDLLGRRPPARPPGTRPPRLAELAAGISAAFGSRTVNPDSPAQLIKAFAADGVRVPSTRYSVLRGVDHPAVPLLIQYKELSRLHTAHGWSWLDTWVSGGRFKPEYVVGGVVSGRWASRGGGALQIPRVLRRAVVADPGWVLVVADAAQLEPRVLAALAGDRAFAAAAAAGDLYEALASVVRRRPRQSQDRTAVGDVRRGQRRGRAAAGGAAAAVSAASGYVERAARAGEEGHVVRSVLGRTCPPPSAAWRTVTEESGDPDAERDPGAGRPPAPAVGSREISWSRPAPLTGRWSCSRACAAGCGPWPGVTGAPACCRRRRDRPRRETGDLILVFFQHDEVIVHCQEELAEPVLAAIAAAADAAGRMVFGETGVRFPMSAAVVKCYADAK